MKDFFQGRHSLLECAFAHCDFWIQSKNVAESEPNINRWLQFFVFNFGEKTLGDFKVFAKALLADLLSLSFSIH